MQLDAMLFLIKDSSKMRVFFGMPTSELCRQILLKVIYAMEPYKMDNCQLTLGIGLIDEVVCKVTCGSS